VLLAYAFALENPKIAATAIEATEFIELARRHHVMGVPRTIVNGAAAVDGVMRESMWVDLILEAAAPPA